MQVRFSPWLARQTQAADGEVRLMQPMTVHHVILALYTLFPGLLAAVPGRANPDVILRRLRLTCNGVPVGLEDQMDDADLLMIEERTQAEGV